MYTYNLLQIDQEQWKGVVVTGASESKLNTVESRLPVVYQNKTRDILYKQKPC